MLQRILLQTWASEVFKPFTMSLVDASPEAIRSLQQEITASSFMHRLGGAIAADTEILQCACADSYLHENGFFKLTLAESVDGRFRVRLHVWDSGAPSHAQNVHNHRFDFVSFVLCGELSNILWTASSNGEPYAHYSYEPRSGRSDYQLHFHGTVRLGKTSSACWKKGDAYRMPIQALHTVEVSGRALPVTLLVEDRSRLLAHADVFSQRYDLQNVNVAAPALSPSEYLEVWRQAMRRVFP